MNNNFYLNNLWRWKCGLAEEDFSSPSPVDLESLRDSEWSGEFETLMRNRLLMGSIRYGKIHQQGKSKYDRVSSMTKRLDMYNKTGNKEHLVDVANLCLLEFEECHHPDAHFAAIDDGHHTKAIT